MSLGGQTTQNVVYGPDGTMYGTPLQARNAGVQNPTGQPPAGVPAIPYGRAATPGSDFSMQMPTPQPYTSTLQPYIPTPQPYTSATTQLPSIPTQSSGGRNRYAEIMANYQQAQPLSFTGMPSTYTGGFTPYQRPIPMPVQQNPYAGLIEQLGGGSGGGGRGEREVPSAFSQMTPAERAAYYRENPTEGKIALGAQDLLGNATLMGQIGKYFGADRFYDSRLEKMGVNPTISVDTQNALAGEAMQRALDSQAQSQAVAAQQAQDARVAAFDASRESSRGGGGGGMGGGAATGGRDTGGGARDASGGGDRGTRGGFAYGGYVSMQDLQGPNPEGPDDGYAALKDGEYVINDQAVNQYGIELMNLINSGKISKGELLGLLEM